MKTNYKDKIEQTKTLIKNADIILIGAGAGLSTAAGLEYGGQRFTDNFEKFIEKYGLTDMYSSGFYDFPTLEEKWAYWSKHIKINRFDNEKQRDLYKELLSLVKEKEYFVLTTNADGLFYETFDKEKIFMVQGNYGKIQCSKPCHNKLYDNKDLVFEMVEKEKNCKIPSSLIPKCPVCGSDMEVNVRKDNSFVQDEIWDKESKRYEKFISDFEDKKVVLLELGVGFNTPTIIKYPFEQMAYENKNVNIIRFNKSQEQISEENRDKTLAFSGDMASIINDILNK